MSAARQPKRPHQTLSLTLHVIHRVVTFRTMHSFSSFPFSFLNSRALQLSLLHPPLLFHSLPYFQLHSLHPLLPLPHPTTPLFHHHLISCSLLYIFSSLPPSRILPTKVPLYLPPPHIHLFPPSSSYFKSSSSFSSFICFSLLRRNYEIFCDTCIRIEPMGRMPTHYWVCFNQNRTEAIQ